MQHRNTAVQGDAGQVVAGNATHDGATANNQLNNVITINSGKAEQAATPAKNITDLQRRQISAKVDEVMAATGESKLDVYREVLTDFGIEEIRQLPRDQYKAVMTMLDRWVAEARGESVNDGTQQPAEHPMHSNTPCVGCTAVSQQLARTRRVLSIVGAVALAAACVAGYAALAPARATDAAVVASGRGSLCNHDGKAYSLGSVTRMSDNVVYRCSAVEGSTNAVWESTREAGKQRPS
ncbi:hypothetical protein ACQUJS_02650 [Ralstonia pseudosolanacearum]|uniref:Uncharacterized protein n=1 Tax=Ralstonia solanacearum TaxID=305 RepID=A0A0S4TUV0_RALSL|nr:hypothetical protein RSP799_06760 [Ralstonia solanacearum]CUV13835.1 protein of unknown function [Ralstonia solanacearum]